MNEPTDIKALDEYLKGGSDISQRYRELGREDVPPELDRRVLAEAHAAVAADGPKRARTWMRWSAPVALAASVVLVVSVVIENGVQDDSSFAQMSPAAESHSDAPASDSAGALRSEESRLSDEPAPSPQFVPDAPAANASPPAAPSLAKAEAAEKRSYKVAPEEARANEARADAAKVDAKVLRDQRKATATAIATVPAATDSQVAAQPPAAPQPRTMDSVSARESVARIEAEQDSADASADLSEVAVSGSRARRTPGRTAGPRGTISESSLSSEMRQQAATADAQAEHPDPAKWLEEIRELRRTGKTVEANRAWRLFSEAYPDFRVAPDDVARQQP